MLQERIEGKWIDCFARVFERCNLKPAEQAAIISETQSRSVNRELAKLAGVTLRGRGSSTTGQAAGALQAPPSGAVLPGVAAQRHG